MAPSSALVAGTNRAPRYAAWDAVFIALTAAHAALLATAPPWYVIALGLWWNSNTISHNFIHRPFFHSRIGNRSFSMLLSLVLGFPQTIWRDRHLRHHAGLEEGWRISREVGIELAAVGAMFSALALWQPAYFVTAYLPGWSGGLVLCWLHGWYEHSAGTTSHYGRLYNLLFFNDGYHVEHHARPTAHWSELAAELRPHSAATASAWPAVLRWMDTFSLDGLERIVLNRPSLQRFVVDAHARAFTRLLPGLDGVRTVTIVGGGLFPRTALVIDRVLPSAAVTIVDGEPAHLASARRFLKDAIAVRLGHFDDATETGSDLLIIPLAYRGNRDRLYAAPPAPVVLIHDWIWNVRPGGVVVSWLLLKRLNIAAR